MMSASIGNRLSTRLTGQATTVCEMVNGKGAALSGDREGVATYETQKPQKLLLGFSCSEGGIPYDPQ
jgi:hypothetical protein